MMPDFRLKPEVAAKLRKWADELEISEAEAIRRLIELGLKPKGKP